MKRIVRLVLCLLMLSTAAAAQTEFKITYNMNFAGGHRPTFTKFTAAESLTLKQANQLFKQIKTKSGIEFGYSYGGCEDRAHAVSLLLQEKGIKHRKIWNFNPYYISLYNLSQQPNIKDETGLSDRVKWGFHVAIVLSVKNAARTTSLVFDPAVANELLTVKKWLQTQNAPTSYYIFTDPQWFSFYTIDGQRPGDEAMPSRFPSLLTGDFIKNEGPNLEQMWVEEGLAVNQMGMQIVNDIIRREPQASKKRAEFTQLVTNVFSLTCYLRNDCNPQHAASAYVEDMEKYQSQFRDIRSSWKARLDNIRK